MDEAMGFDGRRAASDASGQGEAVGGAATRCVSHLTPCAGDGPTSRTPDREEASSAALA